MFAVHVALITVFEHEAIARWLGGWLHLAGGAAIAFFFARAYRLPESRPIFGELTTAGTMLLTMTSVAAAAILWESIEWVTDVLGWTAAQRSLTDTRGDVALGLAGGALVVAAVAVRSRRRND